MPAHPRTKAPSRATRRGLAVSVVTRCALLACALSACAPVRQLKVVSEPLGAVVRIDDRVVGETPINFDYDAYGTRRVTLYKDGYRSYSRVVKLRAPWYAHFPLDYISELLVPFGWKDKRKMKVALEPESGEVTLPDLEGVLDRAELFRRAGPNGPELEKIQPMEPEAAPDEE